MNINFHGKAGIFNNVGIDVSSINYSGGMVYASINLYQTPNGKEEGLFPFFVYDLVAPYELHFASTTITEIIVELLSDTGDFTFSLN